MTAKIGLTYLANGQANYLNANASFAQLDQLVQPVVLDKDLATPPGSPTNGAAYIVAASATGAWAGKDGKLACWLTSVAAWTFVTPADGWRVWVADEKLWYHFNGSAWVAAQVGYQTGAGGSVTQATSRTTGVTLNKSCGAITLFSTTTSAGRAIGYSDGAGGTATPATSTTTAATLDKPCGAITLFSTTTAAAQLDTFTLTNSLIAAGDVVAVSVKTATGVYLVSVTAVAAGSCKISVFTPAAVGSAEAPVINFAIVKAVAA